MPLPKVASLKEKVHRAGEYYLYQEKYNFWFWIEIYISQCLSSDREHQTSLLYKSDFWIINPLRCIGRYRPTTAEKVSTRDNNKNTKEHFSHTYHRQSSSLLFFQSKLSSGWQSFPFSMAFSLKGRRGERWSEHRCFPYVC